MSNVYIAYDFKVHPAKPGVEILIAELGFAGFESFVENDKGVVAYIQKDDWHEGILKNVQILYSEEFVVTHEVEEIAQVNWNEEWEKNFQPIEVDGVCAVRAPFHPKTDVKYDIVIEPKMSFGTGHHETTHMMIQHILKNDFEGKSVLDMGCGTGVLAILAEMKGATKLDAIDIDNWCYLNTLENIDRNHCKHIQAYEGDASLLNSRKYDVIIANINRNILLNDLASYAKCLNEGGELYLSGFYKEDLSVISEECAKFSLHFVENLERNHWVAVKYVN
ncbi:50S ribosomal protein L11 methyltransferase [Sungkyunkwania multivorans]|uniref:Ribosomal protein L11 methyltransferase n=1 Tax=Sungkyunkwania multivorans TaxID=1173618 RepID=A0ABW3CXM4_9FLAO